MNQAQTLPATLVEKVIARAAGRSRVEPGEIVTASVDLAFAHDSSGPRRWEPMLRELGVGLWDATKVAIVNDHYVPPPDAESAAFLEISRRFARAHGVANFFDMVGICHVVLPEHGLVRPGHFIAGGDSHTPMAGAFGTYAAGYGATDMAGIVATGQTWLRVPDTIRVEFSGTLPRGVVAKDIMLILCRELGRNNAFMAVEFGGATIAAMSMSERMVLCNMAAELGADTGVVAPDDVTFDYLATTGKPVVDAAAARAFASDAGARYHAVHRLEAARLSPQIAAPHSPGNTHDVACFGAVRIDKAYIGACVGAKIEDLRMAAEILRTRQVHESVELLIAPASDHAIGQARADGTLDTLTAAGARLLPSGCGACAGYGEGILRDGETCLSSTNRNFKGRMGNRNADVYLGSPYSVAAAAVTGQITDPRLFLTAASSVM